MQNYIKRQNDYVLLYVLIEALVVLFDSEKSVVNLKRQLSTTKAHLWAVNPQ